MFLKMHVRDFSILSLLKIYRFNSYLTFLLETLKILYTINFKFFFLILSVYEKGNNCDYSFSGFNRRGTRCIYGE